MTTAFSEDDVCYICLETFCTGCECSRGKMRETSAPILCGCVRNDANQQIPVHPVCVLKDIYARSMKMCEGLFLYKCGYCGDKLFMRGLPEIIHVTPDSTAIKRPDLLFTNQPATGNK